MSYNCMLQVKSPPKIATTAVKLCSKIAPLMTGKDPLYSVSKFEFKKDNLLEPCHRTDIIFSSMEMSCVNISALFSYVTLLTFRGFSTHSLLFCILDPCAETGRSVVLGPQNSCYVRRRKNTKEETTSDNGITHVDPCALPHRNLHAHMPVLCCRNYVQKATCSQSSTTMILRTGTTIPATTKQLAVVTTYAAIYTDYFLIASKSVMT